MVRKFHFLSVILTMFVMLICASSCIDQKAEYAMQPAVDNEKIVNNLVHNFDTTRVSTAYDHMTVVWKYYAISGKNYVDSVIMRKYPET